MVAIDKSEHNTFIEKDTFYGIELTDQGLIKRAFLGQFVENGTFKDGENRSFSGCRFKLIKILPQLRSVPEIFTVKSSDLYAYKSMDKFKTNVLRVSDWEKMAIDEFYDNILTYFNG